MSFDIKQLDLIDLISERHIRLRKLTETLWNEQSDIKISNSEWFILVRIYQKKETTISYIAKQVDISRQATHKFIRQLEEKGLVEINNLENNKKKKSIKLTKLGYDCFDKNEQLKAKMEERIAERIGTEKIELLKRALKMDWGV